MTATPADGSGAMFDLVAPRYDFLNRVLSLGIDHGWRRRTIRALALPSEARVLDVATGTGDVALAIAKAAPGAHITGLDPSPGMLEVAEKKAAARGCDALALTLGDAQSMPFDDDAFDAATIAFGIRNVPDRDRALREMARVTRPGGRVAVLELTEPRGSVMGALARFHVHHVVPRLGALLTGQPAYRYLARSIAAFPPPDAFAAQMDDAGLRVIEVAPMTFGVATLFVAEAP